MKNSRFKSPDQLLLRLFETHAMTNVTIILTALLILVSGTMRSGLLACLGILY
jgi:hypothetical protein